MNCWWELQGGEEGKDAEDGGDGERKIREGN